MKLVKATRLIVAAWVVLVGGFAVGSLLVPRGTAQAAYGDIYRCLVPLFANACLLWNAASPYRRRNAFWMLLALGCTIWLVGQMIWTYCELALHMTEPGPFSGELIFFLHTVPLMAALALQPHARRLGQTLRYGYLDLALLALWWVYLYGFLVAPWQAVWPSREIYLERDLQVYTVANLVFVVGLAVLFLRTRSEWRKVYAHLFGASVVYVLANFAIDSAASLGRYHTGGLYDVPLIASFVWMGTAGIIAHQLSPVPDPPSPEHNEYAQWPGLLAMVGLFSMPLLAAWSIFLSAAPPPVRVFRLALTLTSIILGSALVFLRQHLVDQDRLRLLRASQESLENLKRLQAQFVQTEKLVSLGQLAAGAAHEINNPLTAILGFADVLADGHTTGDRTRNLAEKIRDQARRVGELVTSLQSFARQVPAEKQLLDLNAVLATAVQLRTFDLRGKDIKIDLQNRSVLPAVRGDPNQLLQVFHHLINNAVDAMEEVGGGVLTVRSLRERSNVVVEFSDTGPGLRDPQRVFDPFYSTKPVGRGAGLGLSICYGIIQEHAGRIVGYNRPEGGTTFRIELPAVLTRFPRAPAESPPPAPTSVA